MKNPFVANAHILMLPILSAIISSPCPLPPVNGIISRRPIGRMQAASESAIGASWFWFASRTCPNWQLNSSLDLFENRFGQEGSNPCLDFHQDFTFFKLLSQRKNRCSFLGFVKSWRLNEGETHKDQSFLIWFS